MVFEDDVSECQPLVDAAALFRISLGFRGLGFRVKPDAFVQVLLRFVVRFGRVSLRFSRVYTRFSRLWQRAWFSGRSGFGFRV